MGLGASTVVDAHDLWTVSMHFLMPFLLYIIISEMQSAQFSHALVVCDLLLLAGCSYIVAARTAEGESRYSCLQDVCVDPKVVWILSVAGTCIKIKK